MEECINARTVHTASKPDSNYIPLFENDSAVQKIFNHQLVAPIIAEGDAMGGIVFLSPDRKMSEVEIKVAQTAAAFLGKQME